jgi:4'-phosphopantetheinyl transferase
MFSLYIENIKEYDIEEAKQSLSNNILLRCNKNKVEDKRNQSIIGYYLLKKFLKEDYNIELNYLLENEYGKPYINEIHFNISHSKNMIAIIISDNECGVDIEVANSKNLRLANKILNNIELETINNYSDEEKLDYIMQKWVSIEAYSKMIGKNFNLDLNVKTNAVKVYNHLEEDVYYLAKYIKNCE